MSAVLTFTNSTTITAFDYPEESYGNPENFQVSNVYLQVASIQSGYNQTISGVSGSLTSYETGVSYVKQIDVQFNNFNNGTAATVVNFNNQINNVINVVSNNLTNGTINYGLNSFTVAPTNGTAISGYIYFVAV